MLSIVVVAASLSLFLGAAGVDLAAAAPRPVTAGSSPGQPPGGGTKTLGEKFDGFCVRNFKPFSTVKVTNELTGNSVLIHTNAKGDGCASVPIKRACSAVTQRLLATGTGNDGKPATVSAVIRAPATPSLCASRVTKSSGGTLPFTGANIALMVAVALLLIGIGTATVVTVRRRHHPVV
jgi:hypothetical protein